MKIILAEERAGTGQLSEQSYEKDVVLIGRDVSDCDFIFDNDLFPMVSRKHAELRWDGAEWFIVDLQSMYGLYLDGNRVLSPQPVEQESSIQFGMNGPVLRVVGGDVPKGTAAVISQRESESQDISPRAISGTGGLGAAFANSYADPQVEIVFNRPAIHETAQLDFIGGDSRPPHKLVTSSIWLGRDPDCAIVFEAGAVMVSRRHAEIRADGDGYVVEDNDSFNGTLLNEQRLSSVTPVYHNDQIRLGMGGPVMRFNSPARIAPSGASLTGQRILPAGHFGESRHALEEPGAKTMFLKPDTAEKYVITKDAAEPQLLMSVAFGDKTELSIGRDKRNEICIDGLQISKNHARLILTNSGVVIDDLKSTNGVYINGVRISRQILNRGDAAQIGSFKIQVDGAGFVQVYDTRAKTRIDAVDITTDIRSRISGGRIKLLDSISISIQPNEFVGILGPSGAGKSKLIEALNGTRPATSGNVRINNLDLYTHLDSLKQSIGYVPQDDIIHRELTVFRTLYYVAKLRLSRDVSSKEIKQIVDEVLDVTGLSERYNMPISRLSGGQRKRVSMAVELITKPSVIFLDEPTSGLDPAAEEKIMKLFRQIAESGRTVIMTTHAMENVRLFDKIVVLLAGKLVFYGKPNDALVYLRADSFSDLYDRLEDPVEEGVRQQGESYRRQISEQAAENWKQRFLGTPQYAANVHRPLRELGELPSTGIKKKLRLGISGAFRQWLTLSRRYLEVLLRDKLTLFILFAQAPVIALLTFFVMGANQPRDFVYFVVSLVAVWFGTSVSAREIIREKPVYRRERMVNLGLLPYLASKLLVLGGIVSLQCLMLFVPLKLLDLIGFMTMPGEWYGIPQFWAMLLTAAVGISLGLLISALVRTSEMATSLVPLILIPQILFSGLVGVPTGVSKVVSLTMPGAWSFDTMKRFSTLDTLEEEGASPRGKTKGLGLYKFIETENEKLIAEATKDLEDFKRAGELQFPDSSISSRDANSAGISAMKKIPDNLSSYITFLHPFMNEVLNQIVLMLMFGMLVIATLIVLRLKDV